MAPGDGRFRLRRVFARTGQVLLASPERFVLAVSLLSVFEATEQMLRASDWWLRTSVQLALGAASIAIQIVLAWTALAALAGRSASFQSALAAVRRHFPTVYGLFFYYGLVVAFCVAPIGIVAWLAIDEIQLERITDLEVAVIFGAVSASALVVAVVQIRWVAVLPAQIAEPPKSLDAFDRSRALTSRAWVGVFMLTLLHVSAIACAKALAVYGWLLAMMDQTALVRSSLVLSSLATGLVAALWPVVCTGAYLELVATSPSRAKTAAGSMAPKPAVA